MHSTFTQLSSNKVGYSYKHEKDFEYLRPAFSAAVAASKIRQNLLENSQSLTKFQNSSAERFLNFKLSK